MACRAKRFLIFWFTLFQLAIVLDRSLHRDVANARYTPIASPYATAPTPPFRKARLSSAMPAEEASLLTCEMTSWTRSENMVSALSWREVKRSRQLLRPYGTQVPPVSLGGTSPSGCHVGSAARAVASCSGVGARYSRPRFPSATIAISLAPMRPDLPSDLM